MVITANFRRLLAIYSPGVLLEEEKCPSTHDSSIYYVNQRNTVMPDDWGKELGLALHVTPYF
jgi:hypothetical protein